MSFPAILEEIEKSSEKFAAIRHDIHAHPELGFEETRTAGIVAENLRAWGYEVETGIGGTGVVGRLRNGTGTRSIGIRADMDALPILEATGLGYSSIKAGTMHACGHDGHTTVLLAAAEYLATTRRFNGTVNLVFQPAEEIIGAKGTAQADISGAAAMIRDGLFDRYPCDYIYALHNVPGFSAGSALVGADGGAGASSDHVDIVLHGVGGHGASPQKTRDPLVAAAAIVLALQTICSRNVDPDEFAVVTVGVLKAGAAANVIPDTAELQLSVRAKSEPVRLLLEQRIHEIVTAQAAVYGVKADVDYLRVTPLGGNDSQATKLVRQALVEILGEDQVNTIPDKGLGGSEDFTWMAEICPSSYIILGNGCEGANGVFCHNPSYDFNDALIPIGASVWSRLVETYLK